MENKSRLVFALVILCFLVSGMAGLIYQLVWMRYLALFLGHTSHAVVAVLIAFMGGLALGNALFGVWADRVARPLALYGWLELAIAIYALVFPDYYAFCHDTYIAMARRWPSEAGGSLLLKYAFSFAAILLPTMLMGSTLPVMTRFVTRSLAELREKVAALYCVNSAGAVVGCVIADFWWIPAIGLDLTVFGAGILNFVAAGIALVVSRKIGEGERVSPVRNPPPAPQGEPIFSRLEMRWAVIAIGVSGFVAMLYEVAWTRLLALSLGSSTHAFSLMLITFIAGIAAGAWIVYRWKTLRDTLGAFAWAELALAATVFASMFFYEYLPLWFARLASLLARRPEAYPLYQVLQGLICFGVMFVPAVCLGLTLPLVSRIATAEISRTGRSVGMVFAVNTLGTVVGTALTGLLLMPALGLARTFAVGVALNALIGLAILGRARCQRRHLVIFPIGAAVFVWFCGVLFTQTWNGAFSLGIWRRAEINMTGREYRELARSQDLRFHRDGAGSTVVVLSDRRDGRENLVLKVNGKVEAGTNNDLPTQLLIGHIPLLLRPESERALVVGLGSGMTVGAVARHPGIKQVDVVEISPDVIEAARHYAAHNDRVHENPRVRMVIDDAKSFLQAGTEPYDVIVSEPSNPWMAGVAGVFTQEYYENCRSRLKADGLMVQWVQIYETNDEILHLVLRTFTSVFPFVSVWRPAQSDLALVGSVQPLKPDLDGFLRRFSDPAILSDLARIEIDRPAPLLALELIPAHNGGFMIAPEGPVHSDFFPELEFRSQRAFFAKRAATSWTRFDENQSTRPSTLLGSHLARTPLTEDDLKGIARYALAYQVPDWDILASVLHRWRRDFPQATIPVELSTKITQDIARSELEVLRYRDQREQFMALAERDPFPLRLYAHYLIGMHRSQRSAFFTPATDEAETVLRRLIETDAANRRVYTCHLAELAWDRGDDETCLELGLEALTSSGAASGATDLSSDPVAPVSVLIRMIESMWRAGRMGEAAELCRFAVVRGYADQSPVLEAVCRKVQAGLPP